MFCQTDEIVEPFDVHDSRSNHSPAAPDNGIFGSGATVRMISKNAGSPSMQPLPPCGDALKQTISRDQSIVRLGQFKPISGRIACHLKPHASSDRQLGIGRIGARNQRTGMAVRLLVGAVTPAINPTTGFFMCSVTRARLPFRPGRRSRRS